MINGRVERRVSQQRMFIPIFLYHEFSSYIYTDVLISFAVNTLHHISKNCQINKFSLSSYSASEELCLTASTLDFQARLPGLLDCGCELLVEFS